MTSSYFFVFFFLLSFVLSSLLNLQRLPSNTCTSPAGYTMLSAFILSYVCVCPFTAAAVWHVYIYIYVDIVIEYNEKEKERSFALFIIFFPPIHLSFALVNNDDGAAALHCRIQRTLQMRVHDAHQSTKRNNSFFLMLGRKRRKRHRRRGQRPYWQFNSGSASEQT